MVRSAHLKSGDPQQPKPVLIKEKSGIVAYSRADGHEPSVLIVSSRKVKGSWVFPVGTVETGESLEEAATRECVEESGYRVQIEQKLKAVEVSRKKKTIRFTFFLATVIGEETEWETDRKRKWVPISEAVGFLPDIFHSVAHKATKKLI